MLLCRPGMIPQTELAARCQRRCFRISASQQVTRKLAKSHAEFAHAMPNWSVCGRTTRSQSFERFNTRTLAAGRNVRFGDLDGDSDPDMLISQNIPRVRADGRNEVVTIRNFQLQTLDGRTAKIRQWTWIPKMPQSDKEPPYEMENGDSIAFLNLSANKEPHEMLVKDRYTHFWIFNNKLELLWKGDGQTGRTYPIDPNRVGRDDPMIGYSLWDTEGTGFELRFGYS